MARFKLVIEYNGSRYSGWQIQKNARTVAGEIERAIAEAARRKAFELYGAGRTDAGVHALAQVAHLDLYTDLAAGSLRHRINDLLPADIYVRSIDNVLHKFHARHDAQARSYLYQISRRKTAFFKPFVWWIKEPLDMARMRAAAQSFQGMHDFASFAADEPGEKSSKVLVDRLDIIEDGALVLIRIIGSHFLWRMVRRMVGVLAAVGRGDLNAEDVSGLLTSSSDLPGTLTAPASGLFLEAVYYKGDPPPGAVKAVASIPR